MSYCNIRCGYPASAVTYDAYNASCYGKGLLIMYNNALYVVNRACPSGTPGSSADYIAVSGGGASNAFDATKAVSYTQGQTVTYNGMTYIANKSNPSGTPGSSSDYTAVSSNPSVAYNSSSAPSYTQGQTVTYNGVTYVVNRANPTGTPGSSADYTAVVPAGGSGTGGAATVFNASQTSTYKAGQLVTDPNTGIVYVVGKNSPSGTPSSSSDYTPLTGTGGSRPARDVTSGTTVSNFSPALAPELKQGELVSSNGALSKIRAAGRDLDLFNLLAVNHAHIHHESRIRHHMLIFEMHNVGIGGVVEVILIAV